MDDSATETVLSQYSLLRVVFRYLPAKSLLSAACVCKSWRDAAAVTRRSRRRVKPAQFVWRGKRKPRKSYENCQLFESENHLDLKASFRRFLGDIYMEPAYVVAMLSSDEVEGCVQEPSTLKRCFAVDINYLDPLLPKDCHTVSIIARGIVGHCKDGQYETENLSGSHSPVVVMLIFPDRDDVHFMPFTATPGVIEKYVRTAKGSEVPNVAVKSARINEQFQFEDVKAAVVLGLDSSPEDCILLEQLNDVCNGQVAIAGGLGSFVQCSGDGTSLLTAFKHKSGHKGLLFSGKGVRAASVLLDPHVKSEKQVEETLTKLKKANLSENNSCAMMFACCGRGKHHYNGKKDVESRAFKKLFPTTPLIGVFGYGEIGATYISNDEEDVPQDPKEKRRRSDVAEEFLHFYHSYCSVFIMLSFC